MQLTSHPSFYTGNHEAVPGLQRRTIGLGFFISNKENNCPSSIHKSTDHSIENMKWNLPHCVWERRDFHIYIPNMGKFSIRITESLRLKSNPTPPCPLNHIPQCHISTSPEHLQGWWLHHLSGKLCQYITDPSEKNFFLIWTVLFWTIWTELFWKEGRWCFCTVRHSSESFFHQG